MVNPLRFKSSYPPHRLTKCSRIAFFMVNWGQDSTHLGVLPSKHVTFKTATEVNEREKYPTKENTALLSTFHWLCPKCKGAGVQCCFVTRRTKTGSLANTILLPPCAASKAKKKYSLYPLRITPPRPASQELCEFSALKIRSGEQWRTVFDQDHKT